MILVNSKSFYTFSKDISPKVIVLARLEFELAYFGAAVQRLGYYTTGTPTAMVLLDVIIREYCKVS